MRNQNRRSSNRLPLRTLNGITHCIVKCAGWFSMSTWYCERNITASRKKTSHMEVTATVKSQSTVCGRRSLPSHSLPVPKNSLSTRICAPISEGTLVEYCALCTVMSTCTMAFSAQSTCTRVCRAVTMHPLMLGIAPFACASRTRYACMRQVVTAYGACCSTSRMRIARGTVARCANMLHMQRHRLDCC